LWLVPRRTLPDRDDPNAQGWVFIWRPIVVLGATSFLFIPMRGTTPGGVVMVVGFALIAWLFIMGIVDLVRYYMLPKSRSKHRHG
jgi:hypothetical protein